ncbi:hypothetical protein [Kluyvera intermedia]|uniref:hypothetical protein n=1 Tax=Kluyvera intermedia TaxID=61648 RepID=UPI00372D8441
MKTTFHPLLSNAKGKIDNIVCLLLALEHCGTTLDEGTLEGAICGIRKLAANAYHDMDKAEKYITSSEAE